MSSDQLAAILIVAQIACACSLTVLVLCRVRRNAELTAELADVKQLAEDRRAAYLSQSDAFRRLKKKTADRDDDCLCVAQASAPVNLDVKFWRQVGGGYSVEITEDQVVIFRIDEEDAMAAAMACVFAIHGDGKNCLI